MRKKRGFYCYPKASGRDIRKRRTRWPEVCACLRRIFKPACWSSGSFYTRCWLLGYLRRTGRRYPPSPDCMGWCTGRVTKKIAEPHDTARLAPHFFYAQAAAVIRQLRPDTIVCTHPFPSAVVSRLKRIGLDVPLCTVITDYDVHGAWVSREVNTYLVPTEDAKQTLLSRGVPADSVQVTGIPVHPNFWKAHNRDELRARFGLKAMPTVLVMGGGWGLMKGKAFLDHLVQRREDIQLVICLGSNEKAKAALLADERFRHPHVRLLGFTHEIDKWMDVSDLLITKPGGMTCTEAMAKGIPMLFYEPIPGQEEENLQYFIQQGLGEPIRSPETVNRWFDMLAEQYPVMRHRREARGTSAAAYRPMDCSRVIIDQLAAAGCWTKSS